MKNNPRYKSHADVYPERLLCSHVMTTAPSTGPMKFAAPPTYAMISTVPDRCALTASAATIS
jgi:hypothetical protein